MSRCIDWQRRWIVDPAACAATHTPTGIVVRFNVPLPESAADLPPIGTMAWAHGQMWLGTPDAIPPGTDRRTLPRLMREAGEIYAQTLKNRH